MDPIDRHGRQRSAIALRVIGALWIILAVGLIVYRFISPATVKIEWDTATEVDSVGFILYRSQSPKGEFESIGDGMIPSRGNAVTGSTYSFVDENVEPGETYYYLLEEVENDSTTNRYEDEMFSYTVPDRWWVIVAASASLVVGLAMLVSGLRESERS